MPQIVPLETHTPAFYLIAADRTWEHYCPDGLPEVIRQWFETHMPDIKIKPFTGFFMGDCETDEGIINGAEIPLPLFQLDMTKEQAEQFPQRWQETMPPPGEGKNDIWFVTYDPDYNPVTSTEQPHSSSSE